MTPEYPSIAAIQAAVCSQFGVTQCDLLSRRRGQRIARPRQVGYWLARHCTPASLPEIGRAFGRDHSTVMHGIKRVDALLRSDPEFAWVALQLRYQLTPAEEAA